MNEGERKKVMKALQLILAASPIILVIIGIMGLKKPAMKVAPVALVYTIIISMIFFETGTDIVVSQVWKGIVEGLKIMGLLFSSFVILDMMIGTKAIDQIKYILSGISRDRRVLLIIVGLLIPIFLEGAAGAGSPAAIAAPFLVGLGFDPVLAAAIALLGDATPCCWGGAGLTTITGGNALVEGGVSTAAMNSAMAGRYQMIAVLLIPSIMVIMTFGVKALKGAWGFIIYSSIITCISMYVFSNIIGPEVTSIGTALVSIILCVIYLKIVKPAVPAQYEYKQEKNISFRYHPVQAFAPYLIMAVLLPVVRYTFPYAFITHFGYIVWIDCVVFISGVLGALCLKVEPVEYGRYVKKSVRKILPAFITMGSLLALSYIMNKSGMITLLANALASVAGYGYPAVATVIGALGSFIQGTGLGSNIMFAPLHMEACKNLGINIITVFGGQNAAASLGNLISPNNVVAVATTVGLIGQEGKVMNKVLTPFFILLVTLMILSMVYTYIVFPGISI